LRTLDGEIVILDGNAAMGVHHGGWGEPVDTNDGRV